MASNSKKRRRVLRVSCILAALIIAGSSFAWFTSKDEVTNRLTANADYGVSIVENFAPPKQWVPGQTVTKEEAVVNTGNIDAFVHQTVSSVLQITVEVPTTAAPTGLDAAGYIKLDETEAGTLEAGSYLAYAPAGVTVGNKVIKVINTGTEASGKLTDFNPTTTGLYIFRRAITVKEATNPAEDEKYEYVGYYYVAPTAEEAEAGKTGTYYKLHSIIDDSLVLAENGNGNLASAPDVTYAKETKQTLNKAPMTYEAAVTSGENQHGDRLVISYDKDANAATTGLNQQTFEAYRDYLDSLQGKTTWDKGTDPDSKQVSNTTGLIDHDDYAQTADGKTPEDDYSNYSSKRLETRKGETEDDVEAASPQTAGEVDWVTVYNNAKADRKTINRGVKAAEALRALRTTVESLIGISADGTAPGLYQSRTNYSDKFHYKATAESMSPADTDAVILKTPTANTGDTLTSATYDAGNGTEETAQLHQMTADTMDQARFAHYNSEGVKWNVVTKPYAASAVGSALATAWDEYEVAVKERKLLEAKIAICEAMANDDSTTSVARITLADNTYVEVSEYQAWLEEQLETAKATEATKKGLYEAQQKIVKDDIKAINDYQDEVNAANEVDKGQTNTTIGTTAVTAIYKGDQLTAASYPSENDASDVAHNGYKSTVLVGDTEGSTDSYDEDILEAYLMNVYGIALKDTSAESEAEYWNGTTHMAQPTYSPTITKNTIDGNLTSTDGVIGWKATADIEDVAELDSDQKTAVAGSLYYEDQKVGFMKTYRDSETERLKGIYDGKVKAENLDAANSEGGTVKIYVNLDNIGDGTAVDKWQYVPEAATGDNAGKDFNFYYTSILGSGQTSSLLIKSLEFDKDVKQDAFRDIQLDLNVASESAQVVYNGDMAESTAANASIYGADPEKASYALTEAVKWVADTTAVTGVNAITDKDPNPKADADVPAPAAP